MTKFVDTERSDEYLVFTMKFFIRLWTLSLVETRNNALIL